MNTRRLLAPLCAVTLCVAAETTVAAASQRLEGWGPYDFGMTKQQAIAASKGNVSPSARYANQLLSEVVIGPYRTLVRMYFDPIYQRLSRIMLNTMGDTNCAGSMSYFLDHLTKKYGPAGVKTHPGYVDPSKEQTSYEWRFRNGYSITLETFIGSCATVIYAPVDKPPPKAGF